MFPSFRDRFRTAINVHGDAIGAAIIERLSSRELADSEDDLAHPYIVKNALHEKHHLENGDTVGHVDATKF